MTRSLAFSQRPHAMRPGLPPKVICAGDPRGRSAGVVEGRIRPADRTTGA